MWYKLHNTQRFVRPFRAARCSLCSPAFPSTLFLYYFHFFFLCFNFGQIYGSFSAILLQFIFVPFACRCCSCYSCCGCCHTPSLVCSVVVYVHVCPPHMQTRLCMRRPLCRLIASPFAAAAHSFKDRKCFSVVFTWHKVVVMRQKASSQTARQTEGRTDRGLSSVVCGVWTAADPSHVLHAFWCLTLSLMCGCSICMYFCLLPRHVHM